MKTEIVGGPGGTGFTSVSNNGSPLVGIRAVPGVWNGKKIVKSLVATASRIATRTDDPERVMAKDGYVISGLIVDADTTSVVAVKVIFVAYKDGRSNPIDTYTSQWLGTPDDNDAKTLGGDGAAVMGLEGRRGLNQDAIGLIILPTDKQSAAK